VLGSDLSIATAYFAIPITMAVVLRDRKNDIPYPWLWLLFVTFIVACGLTHTAHVWSAVSGTNYLGLHAAIGLFCGIVSVGTAVAFLFIIPEIKRLPSPKQQQAKLENLVAQRTAEKDRLILEINHRVGNQLQIVRSMVSVQRRHVQSQETIEVLRQLTTELDKMAAEHIQRSQTDYLRHGVKADGFSNSAASVPA
jgi:histidine kinase